MPESFTITFLGLAQALENRTGATLHTAAKISGETSIALPAVALN